VIRPEDVVATDAALEEALANQDLVRVDEDALVRLADELRQEEPEPATDIPALRLGRAAGRGWRRLAGIDGDVPLDPEAILRAVVVVNAVNYCYLPEPGQAAWTYAGARGFTGMLRLVESCLEAGFRGELPQRLRRALADDDIARGLPLREERLRHLDEVAAWFDILRHGHRRTGGDGYDLLAVKREGGDDAATFVARLATACPGFVDHAHLGRRRIPMFKRAWLAAMMVQAVADEVPELAFTGMSSALAIDYRLPQTLRAASALQYRGDLARRVDECIWLEAGSDEEGGIRIGTAYAFRRLLIKTGWGSGRLDRSLWLRSGGLENGVPHRCMTMSY